jgi:hypothetical protein
MAAIIYFSLVGIVCLVIIKKARNEFGLALGCIVFPVICCSIAGFVWYKKIVGDADNPQHIVFAGRISQPGRQRWLNNRLVLAYAQDAEIGRAKTQVSAFQDIVTTPTDGVFAVSLANPYAIRTSDLTRCKSKTFSNRTAYCWLGELTEDTGGIDFDIPYKKLQYAIRMLPGDYDALPEEMKEDGATGITDGNIVIMASKPAALSWLDKVLGRIPAKASPERTPNVVESIRYAPKLEEIEIPTQAASATLNNCKGSDTVRQTITDSKTFVREYTVQVSAGLGIPVDVVELQLGAQAGYRQKQITTKTVRYELPARPGTSVSYKIRWKEIWRNGTVTVRGPRGAATLPFRVRQDVQSSLDSGEPGCGS